MIVGHKIERYLTAQQFDYGGHWEVTTHRKLTELHATKGWRVVRHDRSVQHVRYLPGIRERREANITRFVWLNHKGPRAPMRDQPIPERALLRHGWYQRKLRRLEATGIPVNQP